MLPAQTVPIDELVITNRFELSESLLRKKEPCAFNEE
jgi:hypothetical protein